MKEIKKLLFIAAVLMNTAFSQTGSASEELLKRFFVEVNTLQADFKQVIVDESGRTLEVKKGVFSLSRPGRFRWNYINDDIDYPLGQQIISDGTVITFYDPDLETANQRSMQDAVDQVPTLVLMQSGDGLDQHFVINDIGLTDGLSWVALKPKDVNAGFQSLMLGFAKKQLTAIMLTDVLGNETQLTLTKVLSNTDLEASLFEFQAPEGVDVIQ